MVLRKKSLTSHTTPSNVKATSPKLRPMAASRHSASAVRNRSFLSFVVWREEEEEEEEDQDFKTTLNTIEQSHTVPL
jgi:hypothetical protein